MHWDAEHQLSRVTVTREQGRFTHTEHWGYDYDPFGRRIAKYRLDPDNEKRNRPWLDDQTTHYAWDGNRLLLERQGDEQQLYVYEPNSFVPLAVVRSSDTHDSDAEKPEGLPAEYQTLKELYPQEWEATLNKMPRKLAATIRQLDQPAQANKNPVEILYYHTDHLGTPRELTDTDGHIVWSATYKAWGNTAKIERPPRLVTSTDGNTLTQRWEQQDDPIEQNLRFQGQYYDQETGLHYNRFRYYDPDCGRFVSQDPIGLLGGANNYQYAASPVAWVDPLGLAKESGSVGAYKTVGGHHVHAKAGFNDMEEYKKIMREMFSFGNDWMDNHDIDHDAITACQRREFKALSCRYKNGSANNTMKEHTNVAVKYLMEGGADESTARGLAARGLRKLRELGVNQPSRTPWEK